MSRIPYGSYQSKLRAVLLLSALFLFSTSALRAGIFDEGDPAAGKAIFNANCASCHTTTDAVLAAPGLGGIDERWGTTEEMLVKWITNPNGAIETGDPYITSLIKTYESSFGIMTPQPVDEAQIKDIFAYILRAPVEGGDAADAGSACPTIHDNDDDVSSAAGIWFLIIGVLFLIIALSAAGTNRSLKNARLESEGKEPMPHQTYSQMVMGWMGRNKAFVSVIGLFVVCYFITVSYIGAMGIGVYEGYEPEQPIWFSHAVHACENEIDCEYCHHSARKGRHAGIPSTNVCMNCHKGVKEGRKTGTEEINKIYAAIGFDPATGQYKEDHVEDPVKWVKVHNLPDHVYFSHAQHVEVGGLNCRNCHGPVETFVSGRISPVEETNEQNIPGLIELSKPTLTMGWCIECHNKAEIDLASSDYYIDMHDRMKSSERGREELRRILDEDGAATVKELGGWECAKCHY
ncbi:MAG: c-type cytochrome [Flavobacteriales bacterium]|nr:c-type cytochrome [Flavobacteriales bacterium]